MSAASESIAVVGCGLIGGSLLRALHAAGCRRLLAIDHNESTLQAVGAQLGAATSQSLEEAKAASLIVLALPIPALLDALPRVGKTVTDQIVTDVAGIKAPVMAEAQRALPATASFVGGHPMAGSERSGYAASNPDLFKGRTVALCVPAGRDAGATRVEEMWQAVGARAIRCGAEAHDAAVARISHLPYLVAASLAQVAGRGDALAKQLASSGLRDTTRVAEDATIRFAVTRNASVPALAREVADELRALADALERGEPVDRSLDAAAAARRSLYPR